MPSANILPLPCPVARDGSERRVGVEVELAGVTEAQIADQAARHLGGSVIDEGSLSYRVCGSALGNLTILLDTRYRKNAGNPMVRAGLDLSRGLVPAEIVTDPILPSDIQLLDGLLDMLAENGATGTETALLHGFGTHLNVQVAGETPGDILPVLRAYALAEAALRDATAIDRSRAVLPFVAPYPDRLLDSLADPVCLDWTAAQMIDVYIETSPSRNHALDMLPLFRHLDPDRVEAALGAAASISARPAYHFRLPDSRVGEPGWSVAKEWNRWVGIEALAEDRDRVDALAEAWRSYRRHSIPLPREWTRTSRAILDADSAT